MAQSACVVGVALKRAKRYKHFNQELLEKAAQNGIELRFVDKDVPLEEQGPFAAILQKVRKPEWERMLVEYAAAHPEVQIFDMPEATYPLRNRGTMVSFLDGDGWEFEEPAELVEPGRAPQRCRCNVPTNTTLAEGTSAEAALAQMAAAGLRFPVLAKPLWADGREGSHALAVVHTPRGLERLVAGQAAYLQLPVMLQQYVDHGGCLFKVYVLGDVSVRVKRNSLHLAQCSAQPDGKCDGAAANGQQQHAEHTPQPPQQPRDAQQQAAWAAAAPAHEVAAEAPAGGASQQVGSQLAAQQGAAQQAASAQQQQQQHRRWASGGVPDLELMERVSAYPASKSWGRADTAPKGHGVPSPPAWLLQALAQRLRRKTGLSLFNFDVIVPMHCHRRCLAHQHSGSQHGTGSGAAGAGTPNGGSPPPAAAPCSTAAAAAAALADAQAPGAAAAAQPAQEEEPAVLDLAAASAAAAEAAAAAAAGTSASSGEQDGGGAAAGGDVHTQHPQQGQPGQGSQQAQGRQQQELLYHLIDINYFPGYEKMPNYEEYMVQFLRSVCSRDKAQKQQQQQHVPL